MDHETVRVTALAGAAYSGARTMTAARVRAPAETSSADFSAGTRRNLAGGTSLTSNGSGLKCSSSVGLETPRNAHDRWPLRGSPRVLLASGVVGRSNRRGCRHGFGQDVLRLERPYRDRPARGKIRAQALWSAMLAQLGQEAGTMRGTCAVMPARRKLHDAGDPGSSRGKE